MADLLKETGVLGHSTRFVHKMLHLLTVTVLEGQSDESGVAQMMMIAAAAMSVPHAVIQSCILEG